MSIFKDALPKLLTIMERHSSSDMELEKLIGKVDAAFEMHFNRDNESFVAKMSESVSDLIFHCRNQYSIAGHETIIELCDMLSEEINKEDIATRVERIKGAIEKRYSEMMEAINADNENERDLAAICHAVEDLDIELKKLHSLCGS